MVEMEGRGTALSGEKTMVVLPCESTAKTTVPARRNGEGPRWEKAREPILYDDIPGHTTPQPPGEHRDHTTKTESQNCTAQQHTPARSNARCARRGTVLGEELSIHQYIGRGRVGRHGQ
jgi:hypothetical protein